MSKKDVALLVAEAPWYTPDVNQGGASSVPFFEGVKKLINHRSTDSRFNMYQCNFYDIQSLEHALDHLTEASEARQILYIAGHGDGESVAEAMIDKVASAVADRGGKVKGLILSSCMAGSHDGLASAAEFGINNMLKEVRGPNWIIAYKHSVDWFASAMLETSLVREFATAYMEGPINSKSDIVATINLALKLFDFNQCFGVDENEEDVSLRECIRVWVRPQGKEDAEDVTEELESFAVVPENEEE